MPVSALIDREFGARQDAFRRRVRDSRAGHADRLPNPAVLGQLVERSLRELADTPTPRRRSLGEEAPAVVVAGRDPARAARVPAAR